MAPKKSKAEKQVNKSAVARSEGKAARRALDNRHDKDLLIYGSLVLIDIELARIIKLGCKIPASVVKTVAARVREARERTLLRKLGNGG